MYQFRLKSTLLFTKCVYIIINIVHFEINYRYELIYILIYMKVNKILFRSRD